MSNYILINYGKFPDYVSYTVKSILNCEKKPNIYLCSDEDIDHLNIKSESVHYINLSNIESPMTEEVKKLNIYSSFQNSLLKTSLWRVFALADVAKFLNLSSFIHFDNDVVVYESFKSFSSFLDINKIYITENSNSSFVFGYMYCGDLILFDIYLKKMFSFITKKRFLFRRKIRLKWISYLLNINTSLGSKYDNSFKYNEMIIMQKVNKKISVIDKLNSIPQVNSKFIFDPADYGFLIDGHFYESGVSNIYKDNIVGSYLLKNKPNIVFKDKKPKLITNNKTYNLVNLHIHSKNLDRFVFDSPPPIVK
jgi:hypothetical protein